MPDNGLGYGLLRYLNPQTAPHLNLGTPQIGFNYLGRFAATAASNWSTAPEHVRLGVGDAALPVAHALEVNAVTLDASDGATLAATWTWAPTSTNRTRCPAVPSAAPRTRTAHRGAAAGSGRQRRRPAEPLHLGHRRTGRRRVRTFEKPAARLRPRAGARRRPTGGGIRQRVARSVGADSATPASQARAGPQRRDVEHIGVLGPVDNHRKPRWPRRPR